MSDAPSGPVLGFEVFLTGQHVCTAGAEGAQVLTATTSWTARPAPGSDVPASRRLEVGGLVADAHLDWASDRLLRVGDEVRLRVVETTKADAPIRVRRDDRALVAKAERRYYDHLKAKYEDASGE